MNELFANLIEKVEMLANSSSVQRQYLTSLGVAESLNELASEFDYLYKPSRPSLSGKTAQSLADLDNAYKIFCWAGDLTILNLKTGAK